MIVDLTVIGFTSGLNALSGYGVNPLRKVFSTQPMAVINPRIVCYLPLFHNFILCCCGKVDRTITAPTHSAVIICLERV